MRHVSEIFFSLAAAAVLCGGCAYERDRYDERILSFEENAYNLYRSPALFQPEEFSANGGKLNRADFKVVLKDMIRDKKAPVENDPESYSAISILWGSGAPLLRMYKPGDEPSSSRPELCVPVTSANASKVESAPGLEVYEIVLSLRNGIFMPLVLDNDYELFMMRLSHDTAAETWSIDSLVRLTDCSDDAVQPVLSPDAKHIAFAELKQEGSPDLRIMASEPFAQAVKIAENASMPFFLDNERLLFTIRSEDMWSTFMVYDITSGKTSVASPADVACAVQMLPYSALKKFYSEIASHTGSPEEKALPAGAVREMTYRELVDYAVRNSPEVREACFKYISTAAQSTQNLFDIGPDLFANGDYLATSNILTNTTGDYTVIGDRIGQNNFLRGTVGLSIPVIPNLPLHWAQRSFMEWKVEEAKAHLAGAVNSVTGDVTELYFAYLMYLDIRGMLIRNIRLNEQRLARYRVMEKEDSVFSERVLYAENIKAGLSSELAQANEKLIGTTLRIAGKAGLNSSSALLLEQPASGSAPVIDDEKVPCLEYFIANALVNRSELREIDCRMAQDAAVRDMGPESTRIESLRMRVSYGFGIDGWSRFVDDFLLLGMSYVRPLRLPHFFQAYYERWTASINALRMTKFSTEAEIKDEIYAVYTDFTGASGASAHRRAMYTHQREQSRISGLFRKFGGRYFDSPAASIEDTDANIRAVSERITLAKAEYSRWMTLSSLYAESGRSDLLVDFVSGALKAENASKSGVRGIYLWKSLEVITSKTEREAFIAFCRSRGITEVFCFIALDRDGVPLLEKYAPEYEYFIERCARAGISVKALAGETSWIDPGKRSDFRAILKSYMDFNSAMTLRGAIPFAGIKLDVEPHTLPGWRTDAQSKMTSDYLSLLREAALTAGRRNLSADVPYTFAGVPHGKDADLLSAVSREVGDMTVMAYLNDPVRVRSKVLPIFERKDIDCGVGVALETNRLDEPGLSFYGIPRKEFETRLDGFRDDFRKYGNFSGLLVHDYNGFRKMDSEIQTGGDR